MTSLTIFLLKTLIFLAPIDNCFFALRTKLESLANQKWSADRTLGNTALEKYQTVLFFERQLNKISLALSSKNRNTVKKHPEHRNIRNVRTIRTIRKIRNIKKKHPNFKNRFCIRCRDSKEHLEFYFFKVF